jgi:signal transduction histidine kinase
MSSVTRLGMSHMPIKGKVIAMNMVAAGVALLLAGLAFGVYEFYAYRQSVTREMTTLAQILSETSGPALAFDDRKAADETLGGLRHESRIVAGCLFDRAGVSFARYLAPGGICPLLTSVPDGASFQDSYLYLRQPIVLAGETLGTVVLKNDLTEMYRRLERYAGIVLVVLLASSLAALAISSVLQKLISEPLLALAQVASSVSAQEDYSLRAVKRGDDEIGLLVDRFNEMLTQIQDRDRALQQAQDELEDRVEQRTHELQAEVQERRRIEDNLRAAKQAAEQSNRAKSAFLANMSHELRTPLNAIIGYSEMLEEDAQAAGDGAAAKDLQRIRSSGKHLLALIQDILDLSKIEAGKMTLHIEQVPLSALVREARETAEPLARKNRNRLEIHYEERGETMLADPVKFRQSLFNLLSNACKFTENGVITLEVERQQQEVLWHVRDTGIGIDAEQQHRLFQSFSQVDSSATRKYGGTGLGLAISQRLCQLMGGEITLASAPGAGSTFTIRMPLETAAPQNSQDEVLTCP